MQNLINRFIFPIISFRKKNLSGKTVLITGASRGLGKAIAETLGKYDLNIILVARNTILLEEVCNTITVAKVQYFRCDFSDEEQVKSLQSQLPTIDILINSVGKSVCRKIDLNTQEEFDRLIKVNSLTTIQLTAFLLLKNKALSVLNIQSANVKFSSCPYWSAYHISKTMTDQWMKALRAENKEINIKNIYFPLIATEGVLRNSAYKRTLKIDVAYAGRLVVRALQSSRTDFAPYWLKSVAVLSHIFPKLWTRCQTYFFEK